MVHIRYSGSPLVPQVCLCCKGKPVLVGPHNQISKWLADKYGDAKVHSRRKNACIQNKPTCSRLDARSAEEDDAIVWVVPALLAPRRRQAHAPVPANEPEHCLPPRPRRLLDLPKGQLLVEVDAQPAMESAFGNDDRRRDLITDRQAGRQKSLQ